MRLRHYISSYVILLLSSCTAVHSGYINVSQGGRIYYHEQGQGVPLIFLHGHSLDHRMWNSQSSTFARHYRVILPDFRGYGRSSQQEEGRPFTHADDILTLMDSLRIDSAHVVGLSMGAFVAGDLLAMHPERLISCTMASGGIRRNSPGPSQPMDSAEISRRNAEIEEVKRKGIEAVKHEWLNTLINGGGSKREQIYKPLRRMINQWTAWQLTHKEERLFYAREAWLRLIQRRPSTPVLFLRGETEHKKGSPAEMRFLPNATFLTLSDCGHMMNMEQPDSFNRAVLSFLQKTEASPTKQTRNNQLHTN